MKEKHPKEITVTFPALKGTITTIDKQTFCVTGTVSRTPNGELVFDGIGEADWLIKGLGEKFKAELISKDGWRVLCENCVNEEIHNHSNFKAQCGKVTAIIGNSFEEKAILSCYSIFTGGEKVFSGDVFDKNGKCSIILTDFILKDSSLNGTPLGTEITNQIGYLYFNAPAISTTEIVKHISKTAMFLSFAYARFISTPWISYFDKNNNQKIEMFPTHKSGEAGPILYISYPGTISNLLKNGWNEWDLVHGKGLDLFPLINFHILAHNQEFIEASLLLNCIWMEAFKDQYGKNIKHYPQDRSDFFLKPNGRRFSFRELVEEGMKHFGITSPYTGFIDARNNLIHTGKIPESFGTKLEINSNLESAIEKFFFTILKYKGLIWDRKNKNWTDWP
ncbi:MAG: hypothetical protein NTY45_07950 [Elusimicrobia bacterium]|nr:hypothetical protein [Elusimicrobiota bacterium]